MENSLFLKNESTPTYMAILNHQGEMESAVVDMESLNKMDESFIDEKDSIFISNLYADMSGCIGSNLKEAEPNAERFHRYYAQSNR